MAIDGNRLRCRGTRKAGALALALEGQTVLFGPDDPAMTAIGSPSSKVLGDDERGTDTGARRSDADLVRASTRDLELLRFTGEQFALTLPQLARLMGRSERAARWLRSRWQRAGWAQGRALLLGEPVFVWLTRRGLSVAGLDYSVWKPNPGALAHIAAVTEVRLFLREQRPEATWISERELARDAKHELGGFGAHRPDGLLVLDQRELAVEVELSQKRRSRAIRRAGSGSG
jgi:hypothetical protein